MTYQEHQMQAAAELANWFRSGWRPPPVATNYSLQPGEEYYWAVDDTTVYQYGPDEAIARELVGTRLLQKSALGYLVTPAINVVRNSSRDRETRQRWIRQSYWQWHCQGRLHITSTRMWIDGTDSSLFYNGIVAIQRVPEGVYVQVGHDPKLNAANLMGFRLKSHLENDMALRLLFVTGRDDWLSAALGGLRRQF